MSASRYRPPAAITLPIELIQKVTSSSEQNDLLLQIGALYLVVPGVNKANILLVCKGINSWLIPVVYHSLTFTHFSAIHRFVSAHDSKVYGCSHRLQYVRSLWIGSTPDEPGDLYLQKSDLTNPRAVLAHLVYLFKGLVRLTLTYQDFPHIYHDAFATQVPQDRSQDIWRAFEWAIPPSLQYLTVGPLLGPIHPNTFAKWPRLQCYTGNDLVRQNGFEYFKEMAKSDVKTQLVVFVDGGTSKMLCDWLAEVREPRQLRMKIFIEGDEDDEGYPHRTPYAMQVARIAEAARQRGVEVEGLRQWERLFEADHVYPQQDLLARRQ